MALSKGERILAQEFESLRARVEAECARRSKTSTIPYTKDTIARGNKAMAAELNHILQPLNTINSDIVGMTEVNEGQLIKAIDKLDSVMKVFEGSTDQQTTGSGCKAGCMGLCMGCSGSCTGTCTNTCTSCSGTCTDSCTSCTNSCTGSCWSTCGSDGCSNTCQTGCNGCVGKCSRSCEGACTGGCEVTCTGNCTGTTRRGL